MTAAAILNSLFLSILVKWYLFGDSRLHFCKISFIYVNRRLSYCCLCKNSRRRRPLYLGFYFCSIFWHACMLDIKGNIYAKFRANTCNNKQVMSDKLNSKWRLPPSWVYYFCSFWSNVPFPVAALYIAAKFHSCTSIGGRVIAVCAKIQDGSRRHLGFYFCLIFWYTYM